MRGCLVHGTGLRPRLKDLHVISKVPIAKSRTSPPEDYPELNHKAERSHYHRKESVMNTSTHQQGNHTNSHHQIKSQSFPMKAAQGCRPLLTRGWGYLGQHEKLTSNFPDSSSINSRDSEEQDHMYSTRHYFSRRMVKRQTATGSPPSGIG